MEEGGLMFVFIVVYHGLDNLVQNQKVFATDTQAREYIEEHNGWHSEIHHFEVETWMVI